jgi:PAS domain S-box-containing protein
MILHTGIKIANSIDITQSKTNKQMPPLISSTQTQNKNQNLSKERKAFRAELGITSQQFKILFENLPQGVAVYKVRYNHTGNPTDYVLLERNRAYCRLAPYISDFHIKRSTEFDSRRTKPTIDWVNVYGKIAKTGRPSQFETWSKLNNRFYQTYIYSPKKTFLVSVFMDITEQKRQVSRELEEQKKAEQQLFLSEKKYRRLYDTTPDGIMARDLQGKMIDCNRAYAKMLGYTKKELRHLPIQQLIPEKWLDQREKVTKKVLKTGNSILFEREYRHKDGSIFPASVRTWRLTDDKGNVVGTWSIVRDITQQKERQKYLQEQAGALEKIVEDRTQQLKVSERLAAIGQTAGMVGHDLRNPLQTVTGELFLAKNDVNSLPESEAKSSLIESLQVMEEQAAYMDKIVSDLQAFVQPIRIDKKPIELRKLVDDVLLSVAIPNKIVVKNWVRKSIPQVKADVYLLKRVLINLVTNAVQAMPDGGKLTLNGRFNPEGQVSLSIQDTGVGIPEEIKPKIFTPLFTTKPRGQGFGLAVCKRVIEAHGGAISFESQAGKGAKFNIQFPIS